MEFWFWQIILPQVFCIISGSTDDKGYFEAEMGGKVGLVPANYLQPVYPTRPQRPKSVSAITMRKIFFRNMYSWMEILF